MFIIRSILYRLIQMVVVLFVISTLTFILMKLSPGNPVDKILHLDVSHVSAEQINATEEKLGLKNSIISQWWQWMQQLLQLNLGRSFETKEPVTQSLFGMHHQLCLYLFNISFVISDIDTTRCAFSKTLSQTD